MYNQARPKSVYVAYRALGVQVEVFDPSARQALALVKAGGVRPVGAGVTPEGPRLVGEQELRRIARGHDAARLLGGTACERLLRVHAHRRRPRLRALSAAGCPGRRGSSRAS